MTDKQIIFKCDVDCIRKNTEECFELDCIKGQESILKQLKAKEQECGELKRYKSLFEKARDLWNEASKTNYKLLDEIEDLKDSLKRTICQSECYRYKEAEKLKQTLTEIKEIAKVEIECKTYEIEHDCFNETRCKALNEHIDFTEQILQKISECEGE